MTDIKSTQNNEAEISRNRETKRRTIYEINEGIAVSQINREIINHKIMQLYGPEYKEKEQRILPVKVFLENGKYNANDVMRLVEEFILNLDFEIMHTPKPKKGSWFKKWIFRSKNPLTNKELQEKIKKMESALELAALRKPQSEVDLNQAEAVSGLIESIKDEAYCAMQIGSVLLLKNRSPSGYSSITVRTLTPNEMLIIEAYPRILKDPENLLKNLEDIKENPLLETNLNKQEEEPISHEKG